MTSPGTTARAGTAAAAAPAVLAVDLNLRIDDRPILRDVALDVPAGQYVALLGANGAGKTSLLRILSTLVSPTSGELHLFGQPVRRDLATRLRARIGLVAHQSMLYADLTARENLALFGRLYGLTDPDSRAEQLLKRVGLADRADDPVKTYSRGMVQRASIARALVHDPQLVLADEPFSGLDAPSHRLTEQMLAELHAEGRTIILAHHDIGASLRIAEQAIVLAGGRVVVDRPTRQLDVETTLREMTRR